MIIFFIFWFYILLNILNIFVNTIVEEKIPVKALVDTTSKFNIISKSLFDKFEEDYEIRPICSPIENLYEDVIGEIKYLDLQFWYKRKWRSLDCSELIDFQICKNPSFDLILGVKFSLVSAKYKEMGCILSAGEKVINQEGDPIKDIKDHISFRMYFLFVKEPFTKRPT